MRKIKEVLRLRNELKLDQRQIARSLLWKQRCFRIQTHRPSQSPGSPRRTSPPSKSNCGVTAM
jgi:hypothetical protein